MQPQLAAKCSAPTGKEARSEKAPLLMYRGRDLHEAAVLEEFAREYTDLYLKLFLKRDE